MTTVWDEYQQLRFASKAKAGTHGGRNVSKTKYHIWSAGTKYALCGADSPRIKYLAVGQSTKTAPTCAKCARINAEYIRLYSTAAV